jgi:hypothetical protein
MKIEKIIVKQNVYNPIYCHNKDCKRLKEYIISYDEPGFIFYSRKGPAIRSQTIAVKMTFGIYPNETELYFCRSCVDDLYLLFKEKLDTRLWLFE